MMPSVPYGANFCTSGIYVSHAKRDLLHRNLTTTNGTFYLGRARIVM